MALRFLLFVALFSAAVGVGKLIANALDARDRRRRSIRWR